MKRKNSKRKERKRKKKRKKLILFQNQIEGWEFLDREGLDFTGLGFCEVWKVKVIDGDQEG